MGKKPRNWQSAERRARKGLGVFNEADIALAKRRGEAIIERQSRAAQPVSEAEIAAFLAAKNLEKIHALPTRAAQGVRTPAQEKRAAYLGRRIAQGENLRARLAKQVRKP